jgi:predicted amidohydrolase
MTMTTVAAGQLAPVHGDVQANLATIRALLERAVAGGAGLVVFPELGTTGYAWASAGEVGPLAETVPGPTTDWLTGLCRDLGCHVVVGLVERDGRRLYNSAVLVGPDGLAGRYRKAHLWSWDTCWASAGEQPPGSWETPAGRVGILICADLDYPEAAAWLARAGTDVIAVPTCWSEEPTPSPVWRTRAHDSGTPLVVANVSGEEWGVTFSAGSCVLGGDGRVLSRAAGAEGLAVAAVDLAAGQRHRAARAARLLPADSAAFEALDRNAQLFPVSQLLSPSQTPGIIAVSRPSAPVPVAVVQGGADGDAEEAMEKLAGLLAAPGTPSSAAAPGGRPALAVLPEFSAADLAADPGLPGRLAAACGRHGPTEFVLSVRDERSGQATVLLSADGAVVTSVTVGPDGTRSGPAAALRPVPRPWGTLGLLTAAELLRPEPARCLAVNGADVIAAAGRLADPPVETVPVDGNPRLSLWRVRAGENNCYLAVANATRPDGRGGGSALHGPGYYDLDAPAVALDQVEERAASLGFTLGPATADGLLVTDKPQLAQRRPELYSARS